MTEAKQKIKITLAGNFKVETSCGNDITPKSAKTQGLLALLATEKSMRRSRSWLQSKLWSDRGADQASASLRQSLVEIRKSFGTHAKNAFSSDRKVIALDPDFIQLATIDPQDAKFSEFLEGSDIKDQEFEEWLRIMRNRNLTDFLPTIQAPVRVSSKFEDTDRIDGIYVKSINEFPSSLNVIENQFMDSVIRSLCEFHKIRIFTEEPRDASGQYLNVEIQAYLSGSRSLGMRAQLSEGSERCIIWSENVIGQKFEGPVSQSIEHFGLGHRLVNAISTTLKQKMVNSDDADSIASRAIENMFSMEHRNFDKAEKMLSKAVEMEERGLFHAWQAQLGVIRFIEQSGSDKLTIKQKCEEYCANAMRLEPYNSNVLAAVANSRLVIENNLEASGELSKMAVAANPINPLAWWSLANARLYSDQKEQAYMDAKRAQQLAELSPFKFWCDFQVALSAAATGRFEEAKKFAELSSSLSQSFRPPLRYLTALYAREKKIGRASNAAAKLKSKEADFSIERMLYDRTYPVSMMKKSGLVEPDLLSEVQL